MQSYAEKNYINSLIDLANAMLGTNSREGRIKNFIASDQVFIYLSCIQEFYRIG